MLLQCKNPFLASQKGVFKKPKGHVLDLSRLKIVYIYCIIKE